MSRFSERIPRLILASQSTARKKLLEDLGVKVTAMATFCDESFSLSEPEETVRSLAQRKLDFFIREHPENPLPVLCCDTLILFKGRLIGKAKDQDEAFGQLSSFSGERQDVVTGWALSLEGKVQSGSDRASVWFKDLDERTIREYLSTNEWKGAAGSYRIQSLGKNLIDHINGDFSTVVGLPLLQISDILSRTVPGCVGAEFPSLRG
ncbi:MAG: Maf family nucleotide pyrophosphatase [Sphaerochaetaceae bacterium]